MTREPSQPKGCRHCGAVIRFVTMTGTGKVMPVDPYRDPAGNVFIWDASGGRWFGTVIGGRWFGTVITASNEAEIEARLAAGAMSCRRVMAHWATCPKKQPGTVQAPADTLF